MEYVQEQLQTTSGQAVAGGLAFSFLLAVLRPTVFLSTLQLVLQAVLNLIMAPLYLLGSLFCGRKGRAPRKLKPKCILITGATSGIGEGLAREYSQTKDVTLLLTGRNKDRLAGIADECTANGATVVTHIGDVTDQEGLANFINEQDEEQEIDLVIANAGVSEQTTGTQNDIIAATRTLFSINVEGVFNTILPAVERMKARRTGQIAIMSSLSGFGGIPSMTSYAATKTAVRAYGSGLRGLLFRYNIYVNVVMPGYVKSAMTDKARSTPMIWSNKKACKYIKSNLEADTPTIVFPLPLHWGVWFIQSLPAAVRDWAGALGLFGELAYFKKRSKDREEERKLRAEREKRE
mmetsp:Transcript_10259/g.24519  ORF Transcript_10259/g.24519 Transcript_10259/m.24519 type:complete len:349 (-) Transcript_10259:47-1093(-)